jgi:hypothetical protein
VGRGGDPERGGRAPPTEAIPTRDGKTATRPADAAQPRRPVGQHRLRPVFGSRGAATSIRSAPCTVAVE